MSIAPLFSFAAGAGATLAGAAVEALGNSPFAELFQNDQEEQAGEIKAEDIQQAAGPMMLTALPTTIIEFEKVARESLEKFHQLLAPKLADLGISTSEPLKFSVDALGNVHETSGHPRAAEIDAMLADNQQIEHYFRKAASHFEISRAGREHQQFSELYAKNPELAVELFSHLFDDRREKPQFSAQIDANGAQPVFE